MRYKRTTSSPKRHKKTTLIVLLLALLVIIAGALYATDNLGFIGLSRTQTDEQSNVIDYNQPPTEEEAKAGDEIKEEIIEAEESDENKDETTAEIFIVDASQYDDIIEVRAFVRGVIQAGTCTATFTQNNRQPVTGDAGAYVDATTTQCEAINIQRSSFPSAGEWNLTVSYESSEYTASSDSVKVNIE